MSEQLDLEWPKSPVAPELPENWQEDEFLTEVARVDRIPAIVKEDGTTEEALLVATIGFTGEIQIPQTLTAESSAKEVATLIMERVLLDLAIDVVPVLMQRLKDKGLK